MIQQLGLESCARVQSKRWMFPKYSTFLAANINNSSNDNDNDNGGDRTIINDKDNDNNTNENDP